MSLKVGDVITYSAGKVSASIVAIKGNGRHTLYCLSNGDELLDLEKKIGKPGGVKVKLGGNHDQPMPPETGGSKSSDLEAIKKELERIGQNEDTDEILNDPDVMDLLKDAEVDIANGQTISGEELREEEDESKGWR